MNYDEASQWVGRTAQHKHIPTLQVKIDSVGETTMADNTVISIDVTVKNKFGDTDTWQADAFLDNWDIIESPTPQI